MSGKRLSESMNEIGDDLIVDAMEFRVAKKRNVWLRVVASAAALALVVAASWVVGKQLTYGPGMDTSTTGNELAIVLPPVRYGEGSVQATFEKTYTFSTAFEEADVVARVQVGNWLGEDTTIMSTYYEAASLECIKGDIPDTFTLIQDGCSKGTLKGYPLFTYGNEMLLFMKEASGVDYESAYWIMGAFTTMLDVAYDDEGVRYYVDRYGILGDTMTELCDPVILESTGAEVYAYIIGKDPIIEEILIRDPYIFTEKAVWDMMEIS